MRVKSVWKVVPIRGRELNEDDSDIGETWGT
jgi:hypothetical protein